MAGATTLLLNSTYEPLQIISWQRAVTMLCLGKVEVVSNYGRVLRAMTWSVLQPAVVRLVRFVRRRRNRVAFSRRNVLLRDDYRCQYCGLRYPPSELTCDHVVPRSLGGSSTWENLVTACMPCNRKKGSRTPEQAHMQPARPPRRPESLPPLAFQIGTRPPPEPWREFLAWQT